jgi:hypothetical protein
MTMGELLAELTLELQSRPENKYAGNMTQSDVEELREWMDSNNEPAPA